MKSGGVSLGEYMEIERRFFVNLHTEKPWRTGARCTKITQYYLDSSLVTLDGEWLIFNGKSRIVRLEQEQLRLYSGESDWTVRVRFRGEQTTVTLKGRRTHATAVELEWEVERSIAESLIAENDPMFVEKQRFEWRSEDGFLWEVDEFEGGLANLILAEVELPSEHTPVRIPPWVGVELTGNHGWSNAALAHRASQFTRD